MLKNNDVELSAVVAVDNEGGIGKNDGIPWKSTEDMKHFKDFTNGKVCVMGRNTFESIHKFKKPDTKELLPGRPCVVLASNPVKHSYSNVISMNLVDQLKELTLEGHLGKKVCIIGGSSLYNMFWPYYDLVSITEIDAEYQCDTFVNVNRLKFNRLKRGSLTKTIHIDDAPDVSAQINFYFTRRIRTIV